MINKTNLPNILIFIFFIILFLIGIIGGFYYKGIDYFAYYFSFPFYLIAEKTTPIINIPIYGTFLFGIIKARDKRLYKINMIFLILNVVAFILTIAFANLWGIAVTKIFGSN